jgi:ribosomal protein S18 acetylase RimI-like enzyme
MAVQERPYCGQPADDLLIAGLLDAQPEHARHLADQPWRLSSPDAQSGRYARLWQEAGGQLAGFAAWQPPWAVLDLLVRDGPHHRVVADAIFGWADSLFRELDDERGFALPYWLECRADDRDTAALAGARGFTISEERYACLERPLAGGPAHARHVPSGVAPSRLPRGFGLRELAGKSEAGAYAELHRAAFGTQSMTGQWRARTLRMPQYRRDLDLVAVAPDGTLAGFCVGWLDAARRTGHVEPLGIRPGCTGRGLAQALLTELSRRLAAAGAERVRVEADQANAAALRSYEAVGFRVTHTVRALGRILDPPDPARRR